jgi:hypothetical protein
MSRLNEIRKELIELDKGSRYAAHDLAVLLAEVLAWAEAYRELSIGYQDSGEAMFVEQRVDADAKRIVEERKK